MIPSRSRLVTLLLVASGLILLVFACKSNDISSVQASCGTGFASCKPNDSNGCETNVFIDPTNCGKCGEACSETNGVAACQNGQCTITCSEGSGNCDNNVSNGCEIDTNTSAANCGMCGLACATGDSCNGGKCQGACTPGVQLCMGNAVNSCNPNGQWGMPAACSNQTCLNGTCVGVCAPGQVRCTANSYETCDPMSGQWGTPIACTNQTCVNGACAGSCMSGAMECAGNEIVSCSGMGAWPDAGMSCTGNTPNCYDARCVVCVPGSLGCIGQQPAECSNDGSTWMQFGSACSGTTPVCASGACGVCTPSAVQCASSGEQPQVCSPNGQWQNEGAECSGSNPLCLSGSCVACNPGATQCDAGQLLKCDLTGHWPTSPTPCGAGQACNSADGQCETGCYIGGAFYADGSPSPSNACLVCVAATSTSGWTAVGEGLACIGSAGIAGASCHTGSCVMPPSCALAGNGTTNCGPGGGGTESCCTSYEVPAGSYSRTYTNTGSGPTGLADAATVSGFRLDKYEVTAGRFGQFVNAFSNGWTPPAGSGKHTHLNGAQGLVNVGSGGGYEPGWSTGDNGNISPAANLNCSPGYSTFASAQLPINCVNWYEAYAFCIWDGGFLPSEAEYEYAAAGGSQMREYAWGSTVPGTACPGTGCQYAITNCDYPSGSGSCTGAANIAPVGTATLGVGLWGHFDLAGEMAQWTLDTYANPYVSPCNDCAVFGSGTSTSSRGGFFSLPSSYLLAATRGSARPTSRTNVRGLRCARTP